MSKKDDRAPHLEELSFSGRLNTNILMCFDWDGTLSAGNSQDFLVIKKKILPRFLNSGIKIYSGSGVINEKARAPQIKKYDATQINHAAEEFYSDRDTAFCSLADIIYNGITELLKNEVKVAIVTFHQYPEMIKFGLKKIGFNEKDIAEILIVNGYLQKDILSFGKIYHIQKAKELFGISNNSYVALMDDDKGIIEAAMSSGITCFNNNISEITTTMPKILETVNNWKYQISQQDDEDITDTIELEDRSDSEAIEVEDYLNLETEKLDNEISIDVTGALNQ